MLQGSFRWGDFRVYGPIIGRKAVFFLKKKKRQKDFNLVRLPCEKRNCSQTPEATKRFFEFIEEFNVARWN